MGDKLTASRVRYSADSDDDTQPLDASFQVLRSYQNPLAAAEREKEHRNARLYEAFNDLHALAQKFDKPFDAPAILVLGHQTDGKSALVEALIGFQFNHVGGGTKTRRPVALHMKYNPLCPTPRCVLVGDDMSETPMDLHELQAYIQAENARLEQQQKFSSHELIVKVEYKHCPNLTIIDTPGLIAAPPGKAHAGLQAAGKTIEGMLLAKAQSPELVLLCLEDVCDWSHATTRKLVMQADPSLSRTVLVSTKFDTRIATFSRPADVEAFLHPASLGTSMLGGSPFYTSVPAGRVGDDNECVYPTNRVFRTAVQEREAADITDVEAKLQRRLDASEKARIGVCQLRSFLEGYLKERYLHQVPTILPLLEREHRLSTARLQDAQDQLHALDQADLKDHGRQVTDAFLVALSNVLRGNATAPTDKYGETLQDEHMQTGCFTLPSGGAVTVPEGLPNGNMRLYGGAQFHRAMNEFRLAVGQMTCPEVSKEEVANACGLEDAHDGANYMRAACVIAVAKARAVFEPFIHQLGARLSHVMGRMLPVIMHLITQQHQFSQQQQQSQVIGPLLKLVGCAYSDFIHEVEVSCKSRCLEDLHSTTRYVTWSLHTKGGRSLKSMLGKISRPSTPEVVKPGSRDNKQAAEAALAQAGSQSLLADMLEQCLFSRQLSLTSEELVTALVHQMFEGVRDFVVQAAELKFNTFFLMPVVDAFPVRLRTKMEVLYESDLDSVFHTRAARAGLHARVQSLTTELAQVERLLHKFADIHHRLTSHSGEVGAADPMALMASTLAAATAGTTTARDAPLRSMTPATAMPPTTAPTTRPASASSGGGPPQLGPPVPSAAPQVVAPGADKPQPAAHPVDLTASMVQLSPEVIPAPLQAAAGTALPGAVPGVSRGLGATVTDSPVKLFGSMRGKPGPMAPRGPTPDTSDASLVRDAVAKFGPSLARAASPAPGAGAVAAASNPPSGRATPPRVPAA